MRKYLLPALLFIGSCQDHKDHPSEKTKTITAATIPALANTVFTQPPFQLDQQGQACTMRQPESFMGFMQGF